SRRWLADCPDEQLPDSFPKVVDVLRAEGLLDARSAAHQPPFDITREPLVFPLPRSVALMQLARAETGSLLALAYSNMRGYGDVHPTVAELRVGYLPIVLPHPISGEPTESGEVLLTECEVVAMYEADEQGGAPAFTLGYGVCFGHNEVKAIGMAILDRAMLNGARKGPAHPAEDAEFVLLHIDGVESMGFATHYKMPHYVTFQSDLDRLRATQRKHRQE
ncbi:MAG: carbon-phosphorus lyase complex subunit PhnI, partial [Chloroflexales bacterium]|nr:carbon-phosphorus lyase complex subunit PhnI [Chloroflexales bacterium]